MPSSRDSQPAGSRRFEESKMCERLKVVTGGASLSSAVAFPVFDSEGHTYCKIDFAIFVVSTCIFSALHVRHWKQYGPAICVLGLILVVVLVASGLDQDSLTKLSPYIPPLAATFCMVPPAIGSWRERAKTTMHLPMHEHCDTSYRTGSRSPSPSEQSSSQANWQPNHHESYFGHMNGPSSLRSGSSRGTLQDILVNVKPKKKPEWNEHVLEFFPDQGQGESSRVQENPSLDLLPLCHSQHSDETTDLLPFDIDDRVP